MAPKDRWDKTQIVFNAIGVVLGGILLPAAIFVGGGLIADEERKSTTRLAQAEYESSVAFAKTANLTSLIQFLGSTNEQEKRIGLEVAQHLIEVDQLPEEIEPTILRIEREAKTAGTAIAASSAVDALVKANEIESTELGGQIFKIPPRVYFQISDENLRENAAELAKELEKIGKDERLIVPGIELVKDVNFSTSLRYFKDSDKKEAQEIHTYLQELGVDAALVDLSERYGNTASIRPRHFELWLGGSWQ